MNDVPRKTSAKVVAPRTQTRTRRRPTRNQSGNRSAATPSVAVTSASAISECRLGNLSTTVSRWRSQGSESTAAIADASQNMPECPDQR